MKNFLATTMIILLFSLFSLGQSQNKSKIEDLLIWKIAEDLKLNVKEEKSLSEIIKSISSKKQIANGRLEELIQQMPRLATELEKTKALSDYKKQLKTINELSVQEIDQIQKALGSEKA